MPISRSTVAVSTPTVAYHPYAAYGYAHGAPLAYNTYGYSAYNHLAYNNLAYNHLAYNGLAYNNLAYAAAPIAALEARLRDRAPVDMVAEK